MSALQIYISILCISQVESGNGEWCCSPSNRCYYKSTTICDEETARLECYSFLGLLAKVDTQADHDFLYSVGLIGIGEQSWIGLKDSGIGWQWRDGSSLGAWTKWSASPGSDVVAYYDGLEWKTDLPIWAGTHKHYLCEIPGFSPTCPVVPHPVPAVATTTATVAPETTTEGAVTTSDGDGATTTEAVEMLPTGPITTAYSMSMIEVEGTSKEPMATTGMEGTTRKPITTIDAMQTTEIRGTTIGEDVMKTDISTTGAEKTSNLLGISSSTESNLSTSTLLSTGPPSSKMNSLSSDKATIFSADFESRTITSALSTVAINGTLSDVGTGDPCLGYKIGSAVLQINPSKSLQMCIWSYWSACDVTCGGGFQRRLRLFRVVQGMSAVIPHKVIHSKSDLRFGYYMETRPCHLNSCPVIWSEWSRIGVCSSLRCGKGVITKIRNSQLVVEFDHDLCGFDCYEIPDGNADLFAESDGRLSAFSIGTAAIICLICFPLFLFILDQSPKPKKDKVKKKTQLKKRKKESTKEERVEVEEIQDTDSL